MLGTEIKRSYLFLILLGLAVANIFIYQMVFAPTVLTISVFAVGKGAATLIQTPRHHTLLLDAGPDAGILRDLGTALPFSQRDIDAVVLTSTAAGASGALSAVQSHYAVSRLVHLPFGTRLTFDGVSLELLSSKYPTITKITYGVGDFIVSSSTQSGIYTQSGRTFTK